MHVSQSGRHFHVIYTIYNRILSNLFSGIGEAVEKPAVFVPKTLAVVDPGFPVGGRRPRGGGGNSRGSNVSKNLYVKMKESGPLGGACRRCPLDLPMKSSHTLVGFKTSGNLVKIYI